MEASDRRTTVDAASLNVKIGDAAFNGSGNSEAIGSTYRRWLEAIDGGLLAALKAEHEAGTVLHDMLAAGTLIAASDAEAWIAARIAVFRAIGPRP